MSNLFHLSPMPGSNTHHKESANKLIVPVPKLRPDRNFVLSPEAAARALRGNLVSGRIQCPGPNHSPNDRSLVVRLDQSAPGGFLVHSFADDDWRACRDYVAKRLGLDRFPSRVGSQKDRWPPKACCGFCDSRFPNQLSCDSFSFGKENCDGQTTSD